MQAVTSDNSPASFPSPRPNHNLTIIKVDPTQITSDVVLDMMAESGGDIHLVAERLGFPAATGLQQVASILATDPNAEVTLKARLRVLTLLQTFESLSNTQLHYTEALDDLSPRDIASTYVKLLQALTDQTDPHQSSSNLDINLSEVTMNLLPLPAREALKLLKAQEEEAGPTLNNQPQRGRHIFHSGPQLEDEE